MKVQKTTTQETFRPIELKITIESEKELDHLKHLVMNSNKVWSSVEAGRHDIDPYANNMLESMLDKIGECL